MTVSILFDFLMITEIVPNKSVSGEHQQSGYLSKNNATLRSSRKDFSLQQIIKMNSSQRLMR